MKTIIDASVAIKWFYAEIDQSKAQQLLVSIQEGRIHAVVPRLFFYEMSNVFVTKREKPHVIQAAFALLKKLHIAIHPENREQFPAVCAFARDYNVSLYDAVYAFIMKEEQWPLITADRKLYEKLHASYPPIQLL